jgi:hypothetical protein
VWTGEVTHICGQTSGALSPLYSRPRAWVPYLHGHHVISLTSLNLVSSPLCVVMSAGTGLDAELNRAIEADNLVHLEAQ